MAYQLELTCPATPGAEGYDQSLVTNATRTFIGFERQGTLLVRASHPEAFRVFVNGAPISLDGVSGEGWHAANIASATVNGDNYLQVSCLDQDCGALELRIPCPTLRDDTAAWEHNPSLELLDQIINAEVAAGFSCAQLVVVKDGAAIKRARYGAVNSYEPDGTPIPAAGRTPVTDETLFDMASNTKMYACNMALQKLASEGRLDLTARVRDYLPEFRDQPGASIPGKDELTVTELLQHQAGFPADPSYHNADYDPALHKVIAGSNANAALFTQSRDEALEKIIATPLEYVPGTATRYSDVDYMLLGFIVEAITDMRLDEYVEQEIYAPLGLTHTTFEPLRHGFSKQDCAATELRGNTRDGMLSFANVRHDTVQGECHDAKAFHVMGGVSGHAGLFSTASDIAVLEQLLINRGGYGDVRLFDEDTLDRFIKPKDTDPSFGLGWRRKAHDGYTAIFSQVPDTASVGHTGWTGTFTLIDPVNHLGIALLTSRRNTPVLDPTKDPNDFVGCHFLTGRYAIAPTLIYQALHTSEEAANALLADLIRAKRAEIAAGGLYDTAPDRADLAALESVAKNRGVCA